MVLAQMSGLQWLFFGLLAVTIWFLLAQSQRYFARQRSAEPQQRPPPRPLPAAHEDPEEAARWEVQMHETARQLSAQLDTKLGVLQALVAEADRAAARLEAALDRAGAASLPPPSEARPAHQAEALEPEKADEPANYAAADGPTDRTAQHRRREEIYTLADYGFEPAEIARRLGMPVGEVQLTLGLREKG